MGDYNRKSETNQIYRRHISQERKANGFTGVFIPVEMLEFNNGELSLIELHILAEIEYFCRVGKYHKCVVKNQHFMDMVGVSEKTVKRAISHLELLDAITISTNNGIRTIRFNYNKFSPTYGEFTYEDNLSCEETNSPDEWTNSLDEWTNSPNSTLYEENKKENKKEKAPEPVLSSNKSLRHKSVYKKRESVSDTLESGKVIAEQKKETKKLTVLEKCTNEISNSKYNFNSSVQSLLVEYLNWAVTGTDVRRIKELKLWKSKLEALADLIKRGQDGEKVVQQSIDKHWYMFIGIDEQKNENYRTNSYEGVTACTTNHIDNMSPEDREAYLQELREGEVY